VKVLHYQSMGVASILVPALRDLGIDARLLDEIKHPFGFQADYYLPNWGRLKTLGWLKHLSFDILHFHAPPIPSFVSRCYKGKTIYHNHVMRQDHRNLPKADFYLTSFPYLCRSVREAVFIPMPVEINKFHPSKRTGHKGFRVGWCAQNLDPKKGQYIPDLEIGTACVRLGVAPYPLTKIIPHDRMADEYYSKIDVWVDRIGTDFYGLAAEECAAMGIPVITQIGEWERGFIPPCPFLNVGFFSIKDTIGALIGDRSICHSVGMQCRDYVEKVHAADVVARQVALFYQEEVLQNV
jgi:hypothetical protein